MEPTEVGPRVTIGMPVHNAEAYLEVAVGSLLRQSFSSLELIISDNASDDRTAAIGEELARRDPRVRYRRNARNLGAAANYNIVVELARAPYFAWANHDDVWHEDYLAECVAVLDTNPRAVLAYARASKIDERGAEVAELTAGLGLDRPGPHQRLRRFHDLFQAVDRRRGWHEDAIEGLWIPVYGVVRTDLLRATALIGPYVSSDTVLLEELLMLGEFHEVPRTLFFKRDHPGRSMRANAAYDDRVAWFTGAGAGTLIFPRWRILQGRLRAVARVDLDIPTRARCLWEVLAFHVRRAHEGKALVKELLVNVRRLRPFGRGRPALERW